MIEGTFGSQGELFFEIELLTADSIPLPVDALLDTGFTGFLAINEQDLPGLGWPLFDRQIMRTARGESMFDIYRGRVRLAGEIYEIPVHISDSLTEVLIGSRWLLSLPLQVNLPRGILFLGE